MDNIWALSFAEYMWLKAPAEEGEEDKFGPYRKEIGFVQLTILIINFIWFLVMIWRGTGFRDFYSSTNLTVNGVIYGVFWIANIVTFFTTYKGIEATNSIVLRVALPKITSIWYQTYYFFTLVYYGRLQPSVRKMGRDADDEEGLLVKDPSIFDNREAVQLPNQERMSNAMKVQNLLNK